MVCVVCAKKLNKNNKIGTCRKHRARSDLRRWYEAEWQAKNKAQYVEAKRQWSLRNPRYFADYRNRNTSNKIAHSIRVRIRRAVKSGSAIKNLGCTISELLAHLESKFTLGMAWDNYGKWHIDHIKPLSSYNLTDPRELAAACHYTNLQPLWAEDNIRKNDKLDYCPTSA